MSKCIIMHHGIKGQQWGVRNGPPYPLEAAVKRGYEKQRYGVRDTSKKTEGFFRTSKTSVALKTSAGLAAINAALFSVGLYSPVYLAANAASLAALPVTAITDISGAVKANGRAKTHRLEAMDEKIDAKTGLLKKNRSMTIEEDAARVNPMFEHPCYNASNNCALCSVTYDLRRRGFDASANLSKTGYTISEIGKIYKNKKGETSSFSHEYGTNQVMKTAYGYSTDDFITDIKGFSGGKRGLVSMRWSNGSGSGHMISYEKNGNSVTFIDSQIGKTFSESEFLSKYAKKASFVQYLRTDDKTLNVKELENVTKRY